MPSLRQGHRYLKKGFTIVELVVVIAVIGILAAITIVGYTSMQSSAEVARMQSDFDSIESAISIHEARHGVFPPCNVSGNECDVEVLQNNLSVEGLPTESPDGTPIRYIRNDSDHRWAIRMMNTDTGTMCKQGFNVLESWWGGIPACW